MLRLGSEVMWLTCSAPLKNILRKLRNNIYVFPLPGHIATTRGGKNNLRKSITIIASTASSSIFV